MSNHAAARTNLHRLMELSMAQVTDVTRGAGNFCSGQHGQHAQARGSVNGTISQ